MAERIAIIGGGVAGLSAALKVRRAMDEGEDVEFVLYEKDERLGGKILTEKVDGFTIDGGPDCYLSEKPWVGQTAKALGIDSDLIGSNDEKKKTFIFVKNRFHLLPDGVIMMVPTKFVPFATTTLFSWPAKFRMGMDLLIPKKKDPSDETLASFVKRRLGRECLDHLAEPLVGGIHASDPETTSLEATFPRFLDMEQKSGSLIRGFLAARKDAPRPAPPAPGAPKRTFFMSFKDGMQELTDAIADAAGRERIHTGVAVAGITRESGGRRYRLAFVDGREQDVADSVVIATEGWAAARLTKDVDPEMSAALAEIPHTSCATVSMAFKRADIAHPLDWFGFVVPQVEKRNIMASTFSSTKWSCRAKDGYVLLRAFVGGPHGQHLLDKSDCEIVEMVRGEWKDMLGIAAEPALTRVFRWAQGMPQYTLGHLDRVAKLEERQMADPGLFLCGGAYRGVGIGDCINSGEQAAEKAVTHCQACRLDAAPVVAEDEIWEP